MRAQQDLAFERARKQDEERLLARLEAERKAEEERRAHLRAEEAEKLKAINREAWRRWRKATLPTEPKFGGLRIGVRLPSGNRVIRVFSPSEPVEVLYGFVDTQFLPPNSGDTTPPAPAGPPAGYEHSFDFGLATAYPRKEVPLETGKTLGQMDALKGGGNLVVEAKPGARLSGEVVSDDEDSEVEEED